MLIRIFQVLVLLLLIDRTAFAWTVYDDGRYTIESKEVSEYIETIYLTEDKKIEIFNDSQRDITSYQNKLNIWVQKRFPTAVKELSFYKLIEKISFIESERNGYYVAFRNADELHLRQKRLELFNLFIQNVEKRVYHNKKSQMHHEEQVQAKITFITKLIEKGYPHQPGADKLEIYRKWYQAKLNKLERKAILDLTAEGIKEFEGFIQAQAMSFRVLSPIAVNKKYDSALETIKKWESQNHSHTETFRLLKSNPLIDAVIKDFYPESPRYLAINRIQEKYPERIAEIKSLLKANTEKLTDVDMIDEILSILDMAKEMLSDGLSKSELLDGKKLMMDQYSESGEYHFIFTARAFDLATTIQGTEGHVVDQSISDKVKPAILSILTNMKTALKNDTFFKNKYKNYPISESAKKFANTFVNSSNFNAYESKLIATAIWIIKLKYETLFKDFKNVVIFELNSTSDAKVLIEKQMKREQRNKQRSNALKEYTDNIFIKIMPNEQKTIQGPDVFDFLFTND